MGILSLGVEAFADQLSRSRAKMESIETTRVQVGQDCWEISIALKDKRLK